MVGVIEISAGIIVAIRPKVGGMVVCLWLVSIIVNLLAARGFFDIVLRDLGLSLGALAFFFLSKAQTETA